MGETITREDDRAGKPFGGKAGIELDNHYLPMAGILRDDCRVMQCVQCLPAHCRKQIPTPKLVVACSTNQLATELLYTNPKIIVTFGAVPSSIFGIRGLDFHHGIPQWKTYPTAYNEEWAGWVLPTFAVGAAMRDARAMMRMHNDMEVLRQLASGTYMAPVDEYPHPDYLHIQTVGDLIAILWMDGGYDRMADLAKDTEATPMKVGWKPWCVTFSFKPGTGRLILAKDRDIIDEFNKYIAECQPHLWYHNYLFDVKVEEDMGLTACTYLPFSDTMIDAYHVGSIEHGLKSLAHRYCGFVMRDFADVVTPHSERHALDYLRKIMVVSAEWQESNSYPYPRIKGERRTPLYKRIERILSDYSKRGGYQPGTGYEPAVEGDKKHVNIWDRWNKIKTAIVEGGADDSTDETTAPDMATDDDNGTATGADNMAEPAEPPDDPDLIHSVNLPALNEVPRMVIVTHTETSAKDYELNRRLRELVELVDRHGDIPAKSIEHVPFNEALIYACADADATQRIRKPIRLLQTQLRKDAKTWEQ
jgi:uracil-DNA glycosylase family 4